MELNSAAITAFKTKYDTEFNKAFELAATNYEKAALVFNSGRVETVQHRWMKGFKGMREFIGARQVNNVNSAGFAVSNKLWEDTLGIRRVDLERDQWGIYVPLVSRIGQVAKQHRDKLVFEQLSDALASATRADYKAYDGIAFYGAHTTGRVTSAQFTNVTSGGSSALGETSLSNAIIELRKRRDNEGNVLAATSSKPLLIIPPALEFTAAKLANSSFIVTTQPGSGASSATSQAAQGENVLKGTFDYIISPWLKTSTEWHLTLVDPIFKPIIFQLEQDIEILSWDKFLHRWSDFDELTWGVRALYNVAPGLPELVYASVGA
jgi:phage major head subunit gpT-like protein